MIYSSVLTRWEYIYTSIFVKGCGVSVLFACSSLSWINEYYYYYYHHHCYNTISREGNFRFKGLAEGLEMVCTQELWQGEAFHNMTGYCCCRLLHVHRNVFYIILFFLYTTVRIFLAYWSKWCQKICKIEFLSWPRFTSLFWDRMFGRHNPVVLSHYLSFSSGFRIWKM